MPTTFLGSVTNLITRELPTARFEVTVKQAKYSESERDNWISYNITVSQTF